MSDEKFKISDFAELCGTSPKTIYNLIKTGELLTVIEVQRGRKITLVISNNEQISELQNRYGKDTSMKIHCYENETKLNVNEISVTENESNDTSNINNNGVSQNQVNEMVKEVIEFSKNYNENIMKYNEKLLTIQEQLFTEKAKIPLLEDKAAKEGLYLAEINELKKVNKRNKMLFTVIITVLFTLLLILIGILIYNLIHPVTVTETVIKEVPKEVIKYIKK